MNGRIYCAFAIFTCVAFSADAQQSALPVVGFLNGGSAPEWQHLMAAYRKGLAEVGFIEGKNVRIEYRWADGRYERLDQMAKDLVQRHVAVIATGGGDPPALAAKAATSTIPVVFSNGSDPVKAGLVSTLAPRAGNVTGISSLPAPIGAKRLEFVRQAAPAELVAVLVNPRNPGSRNDLADIQHAARGLNQRLFVAEANSREEIETAFLAIGRQGAGALIVTLDTFFTGQRETIVALTKRHALPAIFIRREFVEAGGLMSYGVSFAEVYRHLGIYTGRVLGGAKPGELPVMLASQVELVINTRTADALGLALPQNLLLRADQVVQ